MYGTSRGLKPSGVSVRWKYVTPVDTLKYELFMLKKLARSPWYFKINYSSEAKLKKKNSKVKPGNTITLR